MMPAMNRMMTRAMIAPMMYSFSNRAFPPAYGRHAMPHAVTRALYRSRARPVAHDGRDPRTSSGAVYSHGRRRSAIDAGGTTHEEVGMGRLAKVALALLAVMIGAFAALSAYTIIWDRRHPMTGFWSESSYPVERDRESQRGW
jgi:hypothetical protein